MFYTKALFGEKLFVVVMCHLFESFTEYHKQKRVYISTRF